LGLRPDRVKPIEDYKIGIYCFSAKHAALGRKSKDLLPWSWDKVSELSNATLYHLSARLLFQ
jgi:hypothetical protein